MVIGITSRSRRRAFIFWVNIKEWRAGVKLKIDQTASSASPTPACVCQHWHDVNGVQVPRRKTRT
jgi:hypothetical protein